MAIFLPALDTHLKDKGFYAHMARPNQQDGHKMRSQIADVKASPGVASVCSKQIYVQGLLDGMAQSNVPEWTSDQATSALVAAGFDPARYQK